MLARLLAALAASLALALPASAAPRDEALRLAPPDFALVAVVQNFRDHSTALLESPFAEWFPTTALGKQILGAAPVDGLRDQLTPILAALGITPKELFHDVLGDAVVFAYTPAPPGDPKGERSVILVRPRKPELLEKVVGRINELQLQSKELKALAEHKYGGAAYFERQKPDGPSDFYAFRGGVFVFSAADAEIKAVIDRDRTAPKDKSPELVARMTRLGVAEVAGVILINPRALDAELAAKAKGAKLGERLMLSRLAEVWSATEMAAVYLSLDAGAELGLSVRFHAEKLPPGVKDWLVGERTPPALWQSVPDDAMLAVAGRLKVKPLLDLLSLVNAAEGKPSVREQIAEALGPVVGKDKLPLVLDALGPDFAAWVVPPAAGAKSALPTVVGAVKVRADGEKGASAAKALVQSLEFGFQTARIAYNARHDDQIELREEKDGDVVIKSLAGEAFPAGFRPCFAMKGGYLLVSTHPDAVKSFKAPAAEPKPGGDVPLARLNATAAREYLTANAPALAKLLASTGVGGATDEKELTRQLGMLAKALDLVDRAELLVRGDANGVRLMLRVKTAKPLKR